MLSVDESWTLFIDRDGVINREKYADYINHWSEFVFYEDALEALRRFSMLFKYIIVVTNQKGVGKGVTPLENLHEIHSRMEEAVRQCGGRIDAIFYCTDVDDASRNRKPNPGMAFQAKKQFADIDFARSVMVGNNLSDMLFGRNAGIATVFLRTTRPELELPPGFADMEVHTLTELANVWNAPV
jgi:histidinol-phosphate phosphatase family protein